MSFFFPSPIPNRQDMFVKNSPDLKDVELCQFLKEMDENELEIQIKFDTSPDSMSELVITKLKEKSDEIFRTRIECNKQGADGRIKRLQNKVTDITAELKQLKVPLCLVKVSVNKEQLIIAKKFFEGKLELYQKIQEKSPKDLEYTEKYQIGSNKRETTYRINPETEELATIKFSGTIAYSIERDRYTTEAVMINYSHNHEK